MSFEVKIFDRELYPTSSYNWGNRNFVYVENIIQKYTLRLFAIYREEEPKKVYIYGSIFGLNIRVHLEFWEQDYLEMPENYLEETIINLLAKGIE